MRGPCCVLVQLRFPVESQLHLEENLNEVFIDRSCCRDLLHFTALQLVEADPQQQKATLSRLQATEVIESFTMCNIALSGMQSRCSFARNKIQKKTFPINGSGKTVENYHRCSR